ncbi:MAG: glycosyl transferase family 1 [Verrucomicrobia bacterium]|nr:MAG: glycosyl transferase family 1 [Verrucomicrobiota bacterium]
MDKRLRVLLSAYACQPGRSSEPGVGWNWARLMARHHEVWVLTRANNRSDIEKASADAPGVHWVYMDLPKALSFWKKGERGVQLYYYLWQIAAYFKGRKLHREFGFDLIHHITFGRYWVPVFLAFLPTRTMLGPLGAGESTPPALMPLYSLRGRWLEWVRDATRWLADINPFLRATLRRASFVLATTPQTAERIKRLGCPEVSVCTHFFPQWGTPYDQFCRFGEIPVRNEKPFRFITIARLIHWKGLHLSLPAFATFLRSRPQSEYWIINEGPETPRLKRMAEELGIADKVTFWGRLPELSQVYEKLAQCDVLIHPALHEAFGNVCLEAMAAGRPVICLDVGGPALQVTEQTGFKIRVDSAERTFGDMVGAMTLLHDDPAMRARMGAAGRDRAKAMFHWEGRSQEMSKFYLQAVAQKPEASDVRAPAKAATEELNG